jgi:hypothetical protein
MGSSLKSMPTLKTRNSVLSHDSKKKRERFRKKTGAFQEKIWTDPKWFGMTAPVYEYDASAHQASKQMGGANATDERKKRAMPDDIIRAARNAAAIVYGGSTEGASETEETKDAPEMKRT